MSIDVNTTIEGIVRDKNISYMEAIIMYADDIDGEIEMVAKLLIGLSKINLKQKLTT